MMPPIHLQKSPGEKAVNHKRSFDREKDLKRKEGGEKSSQREKLDENCRIGLT